MKGSFTFEFLGQTLQLHPLKALYWVEAKTLLMADLHLGKSTHFRKNGIPVPAGVMDATIDQLMSVLLDFKPERVLFLGDLFHSVYNREWEAMAELIGQFKDISFFLVPGNHDILDPMVYQETGLMVTEPKLVEGPWLFTHHPQEELNPEWYNLAGHIHPGVRLSGGGKQTLRLPCFYFGKNQGILPAFGSFTGTAIIPVKKGDRVFVIAEGQVIKM